MDAAARYLAAVETERAARLRAILREPWPTPWPWLMLRTLTVRDILLMEVARCPWLTGGIITPEAIVNLLWRQREPAERSRGLLRRWRIVRFTRRVLTDAEALAKAPDAIDDYLQRQVSDRPPVRGGGRGVGVVQEYYPIAVAAIHDLASSYGWTEQQCLDVPVLLKNLLDKVDARRHGAPLANPSSELLTPEVFAQLEGRRDG